MSRVTYDAGNLTIEVDGLDTVAAALGGLRFGPLCLGAAACAMVDAAHMRKIIYNSEAVIGDIKSERGKDETNIKIFEGVQKGMHLCSVI